MLSPWIPLGSDRAGQVPGAAGGDGRRQGLCGGDRRRGLHGVLLADPEEPEGGVRHGHPGQPAGPTRRPGPGGQAPAPAAADGPPEEGPVQVLVEEVLLCGLNEGDPSLDLGSDPGVPHGTVSRCLAFWPVVGSWLNQRL